ncbi:hypothetical protein Y025_5210 [Burkholderia pseudomallei TSV32]|nr:hypothetical protein Y025_5210 [Burkholderia pseudomallei TSV32]
MADNPGSRAPLVAVNPGRKPRRLQVRPVSISDRYI